jgi:ATP-dependent DNA ligase
MPAGFIEPCPNLLDEMKRDGYRLIVRKASSPVRVFTRRGFE